jgi:hypothetical protein
MFHEIQIFIFQILIQALLKKLNYTSFKTRRFKNKIKRGESDIVRRII